MKKTQLIVISLSLVLLITSQDLLAQKKESALSKLARELNPEPTPTVELDNYQKLEAQLKAYDQQRFEHLQQQKKQEQEKILAKAVKTPDPRVLKLEELKNSFSQLKDREIGLLSRWKSNEQKINSKRQEFIRSLNVFQQGGGKKVFLSSDYTWKEQLSVQLEATYSAYKKDMQNFSKEIEVNLKDSDCFFLQNNSAKKNEKFSEQEYAECKYWIAKMDKKLSGYENRVEKKQQTLIKKYTSAMVKVETLHQKRQTEATRM